MRILQAIIEGIGNSLYLFDLDPIIDVVLRAVNHLNRFVREISYFVVNAIFMTSKGILEVTGNDPDNKVERFKHFCQKLVPIIA